MGHLITPVLWVYSVSFFDLKVHKSLENLLLARLFIVILTRIHVFESEKKIGCLNIPIFRD